MSTTSRACRGLAVQSPGTSIAPHQFLKVVVVTGTPAGKPSGTAPQAAGTPAARRPEAVIPARSRFRRDNVADISDLGIERGTR
jgi:hypothetical protein